MPPLHTCVWLPHLLRSRKDLWPHPGCPGVGGGACEGIRPIDVAIPLCQVLCVQGWPLDEMALSGSHQGLREQGEAVLGAVLMAHDALLCGTIPLLHSSSSACHEAEARPLEQACHEPGCALELRQHRGDFRVRQHGRQPARSFRGREEGGLWPGLMQDIAVQEEERMQGAMLGGSCHPGMDGERAQQGLDVLGAHGLRVTCVVQEDKTSDPSQGRFLGAPTHVSQPDGVASLSKQPRFWLHTPSCIRMLLAR